MNNKKGRVLSVVLKILSGLITLVVLAFLYVTLIVAQPREENQKKAVQLPLMQSSPAVAIEQENDLLHLVSTFPVPVMSFMSGSGMVFVSGTSSDTAYKGGFARVATLYWQTPEGQPLILQSWYPADVTLMGRGNYLFSNTEGPVLFGASSVRMENADTIRIHTVTEDGLYAVTIPKSLSSQLSFICRSIQLFISGEAPVG